MAQPAISWDIGEGQWCDNAMMTVVLHERAAAVEVDHLWVQPTGAQAPRRTLHRRLTGAGAGAD